MIELYVFFTLAAIGYVINKSAPPPAAAVSRTLQRGEIPSYKNMYESIYVDETRSKEQKAASKMYAASQDPKSHVVPRIKSLTGEYINPDKFTHNNMSPFFGRSVKQNMSGTANSALMENFTGSAYQDKTKKCEIGSLYDLTKDMGNVYGAQDKNDQIRDHIVAPRIRNNEFPIEQVRVGPALGKGYGTEGVGGFQQAEVRDFAMPKCVDELRTANNPKQTYDARILDGLKTSLPSNKSAVGVFDKNRAETFTEQESDRWFVTKGMYLKQSNIPDQDLKDTKRQETTREYMGAAALAEGKGQQLQSEPANDPLREQLPGFGVLNPTIVNKKLGLKDDYGKGTILVYDNERQITGARVYKGNVTSIVKSLVAPIVDAVKITKKDGNVNNPRLFGNAAPQLPEKLTVYDPNGIARTTIKETLLHDDTGRGNIKGTAQASIVYDPTEIAAKTTARQTLDRMTYEMNIGGVKKAVVYDPNDKTRTTMKETLIDTKRDGNIEGLQGGGAYETTEYDARNTLKQFTSMYDYYGGGARDAGEGYLTNPHEARNTQKQYTSDYEYYGAAGSKDKKQVSHEATENAVIRDGKEMILHGRAPTATGVKSYTTSDNLNVEIRKDTLPVIVDAPSRSRVISNVPTADSAINITRMPKEVEHMDDRLDPSILKQLGSNPYAMGSLSK